tara:strand:- start:14477 stop:15100 length:624 start_codon:yes stop_codon:yes gene_type:complete
MAKRFLDTNVFDKEWFQELEPKFKLFWFYMISKCDHAGIWNVNMRMANFVINQSYTRDGVLEAFKDKIIEIEDDKWFIVKFIKFQYGDDLNPNNRVHKSVIKILEDNQINSEDKGHDRAMNGATKGLPGFVIPGLKDVIDHFKEKNYTNYAIEGAKFYHYYCSVDWKVGKHKMKSWHAAAAGWNTRIKDVPPNKKVYVESTQIDNTY